MRLAIAGVDELCETEVGHFAGPIRDRHQNEGAFPRTAQGAETDR